MSTENNDWTLYVYKNHVSSVDRIVDVIWLIINELYHIAYDTFIKNIIKFLYCTMFVLLNQFKVRWYL